MEYSILKKFGTWFTPLLGFFSVNQVPRKLTSPIAFYKFLQSGLASDLINTPMPRVGCLNDENPEKKNFEKKNFEIFFSKKISFSNFFFSGFSSFRQLTLGMGVFIRFMASPNCKDLKNAMEEVNFWGTWFTPLLGFFFCESDTSKINFLHSIF